MHSVVRCVVHDGPTDHAQKLVLTATYSCGEGDGWLNFDPRKVNGRSWGGASE